MGPSPLCPRRRTRARRSVRERLFILRALNSLAVTSPEDAGASSSDGGAEDPGGPLLACRWRQPLDLAPSAHVRKEARAFAESTRPHARAPAVTSEIVAPFPDRPVEGFLTFNMDGAQLLENSGGRHGGGAFGGGNTGAGTGGGAGGATADDATSVRATYLTKIVESGIREARAIDTEALCIIAGEKAWSIHCEMHVLDDGGNVTDAASLAAIAALRHFRRPEVTVADGKVIEHPLEERVPVPPSVHHTPLSLTFAFMGSDLEGRGEAGAGSTGVLILVDAPKSTRRGVR